MESVKRSGVSATHDIVQSALSESGADTFFCRRGPGAA